MFSNVTLVRVIRAVNKRFFLYRLILMKKLSTEGKSWLKACVRYFLLFLKDKCIFLLFRTKYIEKRFNLQLFFLSTVSRTFILSRATTRYPLPRNFLLRKNNCMCNRDNARDVPLVQMNKARREVNQTNQVQTKINIVKGLQTSAIHLIPRSTCH